VALVSNPGADRQHRSGGVIFLFFAAAFLLPGAQKIAGTADQLNVFILNGAWPFEKVASKF
jgi:hypothetical protein